jgi:hypothetical protein
MSQVGFEPTIPVFEWAKAVHDLDRAAIMVAVLETSTIKYVSLVYVIY